MSTPEQEVQEGRKKRTVLLMAGGAVSLILPLLGVVYIKMSENKPSRAPNSAVMFDHREGADAAAKVNVTQTVTVNPAMPAPAAPGPSSLPIAGQPGMTIAPGGGSSLDFVKGSNTYFQDNKTNDIPKPSTAAATPPPVAAAPEPAPAKTDAKKNGKKAFNMPKLQGTKSFSNFQTNGKSGAKGGAGKGGGAADALKNIPGGMDNPEVQKYLKSKGQ